MHRKAAAAANYRSPFTAKAAVKVSPAPVVLTTDRPSLLVFSSKAAPCICPSLLLRIVAPFTPSFDKIVRCSLVLTSLTN